jgi:hypothetical protein
VISSSPEQYEQDVATSVEGLLGRLRRSVAYPSWHRRVTRHAVRLEGTYPSTEVVVDIDHQRHGSIEMRYPLWESDAAGNAHPAFEMRTVELDMEELP